MVRNYWCLPACSFFFYFTIGGLVLTRCLSVINLLVLLLFFIQGGLVWSPYAAEDSMEALYPDLAQVSSIPQFSVQPVM